MGVALMQLLLMINNENILIISEADGDWNVGTLGSQPTYDINNSIICIAHHRNTLINKRRFFPFGQCHVTYIHNEQLEIAGFSLPEVLTYPLYSLITTTCNYHLYIIYIHN